ncbi:MAG: hypothetical protein JWM27_2725 [Gemmatimonadetes bacterium]|nr:hypothetical protein [Gemmatimonadota bacterium]
MELSRRYSARHGSGFAAYLALEVALMRRFLAQGGTEEEFCRRLAPAFHRRYGPVFLGGSRVSMPLPRLRPARPRSLPVESGADCRVASAA